MPLPRHDLKEALRDEGRSLGFDAVGFTRLDLLEDHTARLKAWVRGGRHATLGYLAHTARSRGNPADYAGYAWVRSVLVAVHAYRAPETRPPAALPCPRPVARYAEGPDYHAWMLERLRCLAVRAEVRAQRPLRSHAFCDTTALPEKRLAAAAGLGHLGRNSLLLTPRWGSWVVLGGLLLDLELPPDAASSAACPPGCRRCVEACPTAALDEHGLDARRCLSFWTTGTTRPAPPEVAARLNGRRFGCDACQEACPLSRDRYATGR